MANYLSPTNIAKKSVATIKPVKHPQQQTHGLGEALNKVALQISPEARDALLPLRESDPLVYWSMAQTDKGDVMLTLQHPTLAELARPLAVPFMIATVVSIWAGFFIGRHVHAKKK